MKKLLLGLLLGFMLHKGLDAWYSYSWWSTERDYCRETRDYDPGLKMLHECLDENMGVTKYLPYLIMGPSYNLWEWQLRY